MNYSEIFQSGMIGVAIGLLIELFLRIHRLERRLERALDRRFNAAMSMSVRAHERLDKLDQQSSAKVD